MRPDRYTQIIPLLLLIYVSSAFTQNAPEKASAAKTAQTKNAPQSPSASCYPADVKGRGAPTYTCPSPPTSQQRVWQEVPGTRLPIPPDAPRTSQAGLNGWTSVTTQSGSCNPNW